MDAIAFRPRSATEIVDTTFRICRTHYIPLATGMLVVSAPALLTGVFPLTAPVSDAIQSVLYTVADGAVIAIVSEIYLGRSADAGTGLRALRGHVGQLIGASVLRTLAILLGLLLFVVPGVFMFMATFAVPMAILIEGRRVGASFTRSRELVEENLWHTVRTLLLLGVIVFGLMLGLGAPFVVAFVAFGAEEGIVDLVLNVVIVLLYPLFSVGGTLLYYDLRIRTEGFDLEMMLQDIES